MSLESMTNEQWWLVGAGAVFVALGFLLGWFWCFRSMIKNLHLHKVLEAYSRDLKLRAVEQDDYFLGKVDRLFRDPQLRKKYAPLIEVEDQIDRDMAARAGNRTDGGQAADRRDPRRRRRSRGGS